jgi:hypothetical protein
LKQSISTSNGAFSDLEKEGEKMNNKILWISIALVAIVLLVIPATAIPPEMGGCWVSGGGTINRMDQVPIESASFFGGTVMTQKGGSVNGIWNHNGYDMSIPRKIQFTGQVLYLLCRQYPTLPGPGIPKAIPNYANFGGTGRLNGVDGYSFDVKIFDHGEPGINLDRYRIDIYDSNTNLVLHADGAQNDNCIADDAVISELDWVKEMGCITGGNIDIMPPNQGHP